MMVTIRLPFISGRAANSAAAHMLAPLLIPATTPSSRARRLPQAKASSLLTLKMPSSKSVSKFLGTKPAPMPWILCLPGCSPLMTADVSGSTANAWKFGFFDFRYRVTPVIVPPVPTPATIASMSWPLSSQISGPVVRSCIAGLAGFSNCCGM